MPVSRLISFFDIMKKVRELLDLPSLTEIKEVGSFGFELFATRTASQGFIKGFIKPNLKNLSLTAISYGTAYISGKVLDSYEIFVDPSEKIDNSNRIATQLTICLATYYIMDRVPNYMINARAKSDSSGQVQAA